MSKNTPVKRLIIIISTILYHFFIRITLWLFQTQTHILKQKKGSKIGIKINNYFHDIHYFYKELCSSYE